MRKSALSIARQRLLEELQRTRYGRIEDLVIRSGEPVVDSMKIREIKKFDKADVPPKLRRDFVLKDKVVNFMDYLDQVRDGVIPVVYIEDGLPVRAENFRSA